MPIYIHTYSIMYLQSPRILACFPIPEPQFAFWITRSQELPIRGELESTCVPWILMPREFLLPVQLEVTLAVIDNYFVVHWLPCEVFLVGMECRCGHCLHIWFCYVFRYYWNSKFPYEDLLVICCGDKTLTILYKCYCINSPLMFFILQHDLTWISIILHNLLISTSSQEHILPVIPWTKLDTHRCLSISETPDNLTRISIPQLYDSIKACRQEPASIIGETYILDSLGVTHVRAETLAMGHHIPDLYCRVKGGGEE